MNIQFLGTAAAEGVPALFCDCDTCRIARKKGGRYVRTRSQSIIDHTLLIDLGPDMLMHSLVQGLDLSHVENCLVTHTHSDHLLLSNLFVRRRGFANLAPDTKPLTVWGSEELGKEIGADQDGRVNPDDSVLYRQLLPYTPTEVGAHVVTALPAQHGTSQPYNYVIQSPEQGKALLYAHDTGLWDDEAVWQYLKESGIVFDAVSMDCTFANDAPYKGSHHMCLSQNVEMRDRLRAIGVANEATVFISNHFSHNGSDASYDTFERMAAEHGLLTSYDGMTLEF